MADITVRLLSEQRKRMVGSILGALEEVAKPRCTPAEWDHLRTKVLDSVGVFYDLCRDVIKISDEDSLVSAEGLALIRSVHDAQARLERGLRAHADT